MNIQQPIPVAKHVREFVYVDASGNAKRICTQEVPSSQPLPNVGDQITFSKSLENELGTKSGVFRVIQRRFPVMLDGPSISTVVFFFSDEKGKE